MASSFPEDIDSFTIPGGSETLGGSTPKHTESHQALADAIVAIEETLRAGGIAFAVCVVDDSTDNLATIDAAIASLPAAGGTVQLIPAGNIRVSGSIVLPNYVKLKGLGANVTSLRPTDGFTSGAPIVTNLHTDGTQEAAYVEDLNIAGRSISAGIKFESLFVPSSIRSVIASYCDGPGIHVKANTNNGGPIILEDIWSFYNAGADQILIEGGQVGLWGRNLTVENMDAGYAGINITEAEGSNNPSYGHHISGVHCETSNNDTCAVLLNRTSAVWVDSVTLSATGTGHAGVRITGPDDDVFGSTNIEIRNVYAPTGMYAVDDQTRSVTVTGMCPTYSTDPSAAVPATRQTILFYKAAPAASTTNLSIQPPGETTNNNFVVPFAGSVVGISVINDTASVSAGTLTVNPAVNGALKSDLGATLNTDNQLKRYATVAPATITFAAGDYVGVFLNTSSDYVPGTPASNILVALVVQF